METTTLSSEMLIQLDTHTHWLHVQTNTPTHTHTHTYFLKPLHVCVPPAEVCVLSAAAWSRPDVPETSSLCSPAESLNSQINYYKFSVSTDESICVLFSTSYSLLPSQSWTLHFPQCNSTTNSSVRKCGVLMPAAESSAHLFQTPTDLIRSQTCRI